MRPLQQVLYHDLNPGKTYLIQGKSPYEYIRFKGEFVKNEYPESPIYCITSYFTNVKKKGNNRYIDLQLRDAWWIYYEADAIERYMTTHVIREIIGDPDFMYPAPHPHPSNSSQVT